MYIGDIILDSNTLEQFTNLLYDKILNGMNPLDCFLLERGEEIGGWLGGIIDGVTTLC